MGHFIFSAESDSMNTFFLHFVVKHISQYYFFTRTSVHKAKVRSLQTYLQNERLTRHGVADRVMTKSVEHVNSVFVTVKLACFCRFLYAVTSTGVCIHCRYSKVSK